MTALRAVIVGGVDYAEADRIVHVLTASGRASWFAHGAKKSRRRFAGALEAFTTVDATLEVRRRQGMGVVASLTVVRSRAAIGLGLERSALASYLTELCARVAPEGEDARAIMEILEQVLDRLETHDASHALRRAVELVLLGPLGYRPETEACAVCGAQVGAAVVPFDPARGGLLCATHGEGAAAIGPKTRAWVHAVLAQQRAAIDGPEVGLDAAWAETAALKVGRSLDAFYRTLLDGPLRSRAWLDEVMRAP